MPRSKINNQANNQANIQAKLRWGLLGSSGKMGSEVVRIFSEDASYSKKMQLVFEDSGRNQESLLEKLFESKPKVLLDFSRPEALLPISLALKKIKCRVLVCSTGWTFEQKKIFMKHLGQKNVTWLPNTSEGVSLLIKAVQAVCKNLSDPQQTKITIFEAHHIHKKDAPSGTALWLKEAISECLGKQCPSIEFESQREGEIIGIHRVFISLPSETLELAHKAEDRKIFAKGALKHLSNFK